MTIPERIQAQLASLTRASKTPGIHYVAVNAGGIVFEHASGWADIRARHPLEPVTTQMAYSMSKTITAAAALQLVESGRLELDAPIARYLASQPYGPAVTVRQLIAHTSGIPNPIPLRWVHPAASHARFDEAAALAKVLHEHPRLSFEPGTEYGYSNIGYWLLGTIMEQIAGASLSASVEENVLRRLNIPSSALQYVIPDPRRHATGYLEKYSIMNLTKGFLIDRDLVGDYAGRWLEIRSHYLNGPAFGGLVGSARGFAAFLQDQLRPHSALFSDATRTLFCTPQATTRGKPVPMTLGWHIGTGFLYKEGGGGGFHSMMRLYPAHGVGTVVMCNATGFDIRRLLGAVDPAFLTS